MGSTMYWGAQGTRVYGNGVRGLSGCTGDEGTWDISPQCIGVHRAKGCLEMGCVVYWGAQGIRVHGNGVHDYQGMQSTRVHRNGVHGLLGFRRDGGAWEWGP